MKRPKLAGGLMSIIFSVLLVAPTLAASPTATPLTKDLTAGPPPGPWQVYDQGTGTRTAAEIWGDKASSVKGFADGYQNAWDQTGQALVDRVEHFTSLVWASLRLSESRTAAKRNPQHSSFVDIAGFGPSAYEVTDPADSAGFLTDTIVFANGDYVAVIAMAAVGGVPRVTLLDQGHRQYALLPAAAGEVQSIATGILVGGAVVVALIVGLVIAGAVIVLVIVLTRSRRRGPAFAAAYPSTGFPVAPFQLSADGRYWWDGQAWQDAAARVPPGAQMSPDRTQWWDGRAWRPVPPGGGAG